MSSIFPGSLSISLSAGGGHTQGEGVSSRDWNPGQQQEHHKDTEGGGSLTEGASTEVYPTSVGLQVSR